MRALVFIGLPIDNQNRQKQNTLLPARTYLRIILHVLESISHKIRIKSKQIKTQHL